VLNFALYRLRPIKDPDILLVKILLLAACLSGVMVLGACSQNESPTGSFRKSPQITTTGEASLVAPNVADSSQDALTKDNPGKIVPPVKELDIEDLASTPSMDSTPLPNEVISAEDVYQVLSDYGLFYETDANYIDTAAALTRDGGYAEWIDVVRREAQKQYPAAAAEIAQGKTMKEIMVPWVAIYANKKGINPNIVDWEQTDLLRYIVALETWPAVEEFSIMVDTSDF